MRIRVRCDDADAYTWTARLIQPDLTVKKDIALRPSATTLTVIFTHDWYGANGGEAPARWKVVSTRRAGSAIAEVDTAPDHGWGDFTWKGSL